MKNMHIAFSPPDITEEEIAEVVDTLRSGWITTGPKTKLFEKKLSEYMETNRVVCLNSATACLEMTLRLLGIGPGDEVITTAYTYTASASVVEHVGAKLILVDVAKDSYEMDYEKLAEVDEKRPELAFDVQEQVNIEIKYEGYIKRQMQQVAQFKKLEGRKLPENFDYAQVNSLRKEAVQKLNKIQPSTIGQASRISGVSPADISVLMVYLERSKSEA